MFKGYFTALITPFTEDGKAIDIKALEVSIERQIDSGIHGLVPCGTTGETPTLSEQEWSQVIETTVKTADGRVPVIAGAGSNSTEHAVYLTKKAKELGASAVLSVVPYYNKPNQEGIFRHFEAISKVGIPVVLYDIPGRSVVGISHDLFKKLAKLPNIIGVKDATADLQKPLERAVDIGSGFIQFSGEDATILPFLIQGGHGCISVTSNIAPKLCVDMYDLFEAGDIKKAQEINQKLLQLHNAMFCETNPAPAKYASKILGITSGAVRLPMVEISKNAKEQVENTLNNLGLK
jgi:4-hydroxy-tetrahydrodipicolinate synthase